MLIKEIEAICRATKTVRLISPAGGAQWIGNGSALYKLEGMPRMDSETALSVLSIPADKRAQWKCDEDEVLPGGLDIAEAIPGEEALAALPLALNLQGMSLLPFATDDRDVAFVDADLFRPVRDIREIRRLWLRHNDAGLPYVAIKEGMLLVGLIAPFMLGAEEAKLLKLYAMQARVDEIIDGVSS